MGIKNDVYNLLWVEIDNMVETNIEILKSKYPNMEDHIWESVASEIENSVKRAAVDLDVSYSIHLERSKYHGKERVSRT